MDAEETAFSALDALDDLPKLNPELVAWANEAAAITAEAAEFRKRRAVLASRTASAKSALRSEERKLGVAVVRLLKTDAELRAVLLSKLLAAAKPEDKATLEQLWTVSTKTQR